MFWCMVLTAHVNFKLLLFTLNLGEFQQVTVTAIFESMYRGGKCHVIYSNK